MTTSARTIVQGSLFGTGAPAVDPTALDRTAVDPTADPARLDLGDGAWVERFPAWVTGEQTLFEELCRTTTWQASSRPMYDRWVEVPRLTATLPRDGPGHPVLDEAAAALAARYGEPFERISLALYRDGRDSVAPHGDQVARDLDTSVMATLSCGAPRRFLLAPVRGGRSVALELGRGDLLVMGGTVQRTWRHSVPKTHRPVGSRLCIMFRPPWVS